MESNDTKSAVWNGEWSEPTSESGTISVAVLEEAPSLTVATIAAVTAVVLLAIAAVFLLGVLLDCRQQKMLEKKMGEVKRLKNKRRLNINSHSSGDDVVSIAQHMEEAGRSRAPADTLREIP